MSNFIKENVAVVPVYSYVEKLRSKYYLKQFQYMIPFDIIVAAILNELPPYYATTIVGKKIQLKKLEAQKKAWQSTAYEIFHKLTEKYNDTKWDFMPLENGIVNVNEILVAERYDYLIDTQFKDQAELIERAQVEAKVLNTMKPNYVATASDLNRQKAVLSKQRILGIHPVRKAINLVLAQKIYHEPLTDNLSTIVKEIKQKNLKLHNSHHHHREKYKGFATNY